MLLDSRVRPLVRLVSALMPLALLSMILLIFSSFLSVAGALLAGVTASGIHCSAGAGARAVTLLVLTSVSTSCALLLLSFARAVFTDPGSVPAALAHLYRGLREEFLLRQQPRYLHGAAAAHASEAAAQHAAYVQALPPELRGIAGSGGGGGGDDSDGDEYASLTPAKAYGRAAPQLRGSAPTAAAAGAPALAALAAAEAAAPGAAAQPLPQLPAAAEAHAAAAAAPLPLPLPPLPGGAPWALLARVPLAAIPETLFTRPGPHDPRWCRRSQAVKPPRAHYCSTCGRVVLKMDHHCPWVGNCVGYGNYKAFLLLILHGWAATGVLMAWWVPLAMGAWLPLQPPSSSGSGSGSGSGSADAAARASAAAAAANASLSYAALPAAGSIAVVLGLAFFAVLTLFAGMHLWLVLAGRTTLEAQLLGSEGRAYDFGPARNWALVMGGRARGWLWPSRPADVDWATLWGTQWQRHVGEAAAVAAAAEAAAAGRGGAAQGSGGGGGGGPQLRVFEYLTKAEAALEAPV